MFAPVTLDIPPVVALVRVLAEPPDEAGRVEVSPLNKSSTLSVPDVVGGLASSSVLEELPGIKLNISGGNVIPLLPLLVFDSFSGGQASKI